MMRAQTFEYDVKDMTKSQILAIEEKLVKQQMSLFGITIDKHKREEKQGIAHHFDTRDGKIFLIVVTEPEDLSVTFKLILTKN